MMTKQHRISLATFGFASLALIAVALGDGGQLTPGGLRAVTADAPLSCSGTTTSHLVLGYSTGLTTSSGSLVVDEAREQRRVTGTCGTGLAVGSINSDGTVNCNAAGAGTTPTVTFSVSNTLPSTLNLSTEGTIDWAYPGAQNLGAGAMWQQVPSAVHAKKGAGLIWRSFLGMNPTGTTGTASDSAIAGTTFTSTASDDLNGNALSSTACTTLFTGTAVVGHGHVIHVPAMATQQVLRWYGSYFGTVSSTWTVTVTYEHSGTFTQTFTQANTQQNKLITITFTGGVPAEDVAISVLVTTATNTTSTCVFGITLAPT
jgi:hypothetical protein